MKNQLKAGTTVLLSAVFFLGSAGGLSAQAQETGAEGDELKKLIHKRFDSNLDGNLSAGEQAKAVAFLNEIDKNGDGEISLSERTVAMSALQQTSDPAKLQVTEKMTIDNRNQSKRAVKWKEYMRTLPHGFGPRIFTSKVMPGEPGFNVNGEKEVDPTEVEGGVVIGERAPTYEELKKHRAERDAAHKSDRKRKMGAVEVRTAPEQAVAAAKKSANKGYYDNTLILVKDGVHTVLPQGAILNMPPELEGMLVKEPKGDLMRWPDFLKKYGHVIDTREVTWETVKGEDPIREEEKKAFAKKGKMVVAVFKKNPVTVLEPPEEEKEVTGAVVSGNIKKGK